MPSLLHSSLSILAIAHSCTAAAIEKRDGSIAFSIDQVARPAVPQSIVAKVFAPWAKYKGTLSAGRLALLYQNGSVTTQPGQYDSFYFTPVTIGDQEFVMDLDTGSSDLWVFSVLNKTAGENHTLYNPSSTAQLVPNATWNITYGDGSGASGVVYTDTVAVGPVKAAGQVVEAAVSASEFPADGLLGLAFEPLNTVQPGPVSPFFDTVRNTLKSRVFAANLKHNAPGTWDFGWTDRSKYTGGITFAPVTTNHTSFWTIPAKQYRSGNGTFSQGILGDVVIDSGTSLIYVNDDAVEQYYSKVTNGTIIDLDGLFVVSCDATFPDWTVYIQGVKWTVPGKYINYAPFADGYCLGGIQSSYGMEISILGDVFMKNFYVIFNREQDIPRVGFAQRPSSS